MEFAIRESGGFRLAALVAIGLAATSLAGCASRNPTTGSISGSGGSASRLESMSPSARASAIDQLGRAYARNPKDRDTAIAFAQALTLNNRNDQALAVMRKTAIYHSNDRKVLAAYGKALAGAGAFEPALDAIRRAQTPEYPDWRLISAEASILDQLGQTDEARQLFARAMQLAPNEPSIISNLGMSYLVQGDLGTAEQKLRQAASLPGADSRVRQNLALAVGLQGRFEEAERIAAQELDPQQAAANVTYLRSMLSQQNSWAQLSNDKKKKAN